MPSDGDELLDKDIIEVFHAPDTRLIETEQTQLDKRALKKEVERNSEAIEVTGDALTDQGLGDGDETAVRRDAEVTVERINADLESR